VVVERGVIRARLQLPTTIPIFDVGGGNVGHTKRDTHPSPQVTVLFSIAQLLLVLP